MRLISFSMTEPQILDKSKTVTRRRGWLFAKVGMELRGVHKCMGLKFGERPRQLAIIRITAVRREPLYLITAQDVTREGYAGRSRAWFIRKFCAAMKCSAHDNVTRIEFEYVTDSEEAAS